MKKVRIHKDLIASALVLICVMVVLAFMSDYFFDLNDDCLMKDILSGVYTGTPEGHNIQMLYPISFVLSLFYRLWNKQDWYGIFLCGLQFLCFFLVINRSISLITETKRKVIVAIALLTLIFGFYLPHMFFVQYTVVCGLMAATAAFLIITSENNEEHNFVKENIIPVCLIWIAYLIRSEMLLLMLPMVGVAIFIKWFDGDKKKLFKSYLGLCVVIAAGLFISVVLNRMAYSNPEWKEFNRLFDNRTELYDFQYIPDYAENKEFFDSIGLAESSHTLLVNYNFGLDDSINADTLGSIADYAASKRGEQAPLFERMAKALRLYIYRLHQVSMPASYEYPMTDFPWNLGVIVLYATVCIALFCQGKRWNVLLLILLFACRSTLWMYIIVRGRDPIRITHPLYFIETVILVGMLINSKALHLKKVVFGITVFILIGVVAIPSQYKVIRHEQDMRNDMRANYQALYDYFKANADSYFLIDVYTSVSYADLVDGEVATYSEKMFENVDNSFSNYDILGGWASKSPIYREKLKKNGFDTAEEALLQNNTYFVQTKDKDTGWLKEYYYDKGIKVDIIQKELINDIFAVYKLERLEQ